MSGFATDVAKQVLVEDKSLKKVDYGQAFETAAVSGVFGGVMELGSAAISKVDDSAAVLVKKAKIPEKFKKFTLPGSKGKSADADLDMPAAGKSKGADLNMPAAGKSTGADLDTPSASKSTGSLPDMPQGTKNSQIDMEDLSGQAGPSVELPEPAGKPKSGVPELPTGGKVDLDYIVVDPSTITPTNSGPLKMNLQFFAESGRNSLGVVTGSGNSNVSRMMRGKQGNIGLIPQEVASKLKGRSFNGFDDFRGEFWKEVANSSYAKEFSFSNVGRMQKGLAPRVLDTQQYDGALSYVLHHKKPIYDGGGVYDLDNLVIVTPRMHQEILDKSYHFNY